MPKLNTLDNRFYIDGPDWPRSAHEFATERHYRSAFRNTGQERPTVESADADFNVLGIQMRGYHDFGVAKQDFRRGVKLKGEA